MKKNFYPFVAFLVLVATILACTSPLGGQTASPNEVETIVAATFQALTPVASISETPAPAPAGILPHSLYYLNNDSIGVAQVFRLGTDGSTVTQLTLETSAVGAYDVSLADGSVVYVANNQLLFINADGTGRRLLVDGGPMDPNNQFATSINSPIFSPDGQTIAYWNKGLNLYAVATGATNLVLENQVTDPISGAPVPGELYLPQKYSPDGSKILITVAIPNSDGISAGIYSPTTDALVRLTGGDGARVCCSGQAWSPDSSTLYVGIPYLGMFSSGLWRADASSGNLTTLLPTEAGGGNFNLANQPYLAPDGQLYFFFASQPAPDGFTDNAPLQIVRSSPDGVTGRIVLRPETFETLNEALWAPDASFVIVAKAPSDSVYAGGIIELYYTNATRSMVSLVPFGQQLKWGP